MKQVWIYKTQEIPKEQIRWIVIAISCQGKWMLQKQPKDGKWMLPARERMAGETLEESTKILLENCGLPAETPVTKILHVGVGTEEPQSYGRLYHLELEAFPKEYVSNQQWVERLPEELSESWLQSQLFFEVQAWLNIRCPED